MDFGGKQTVDTNGTRSIGEHSSKTQLKGKGIKIKDYGVVQIGTFHDGDLFPGNFIET